MNDLTRYGGAFPVFPKKLPVKLLFFPHTLGYTAETEMASSYQFAGGTNVGDVFWVRRSAQAIGWPPSPRRSPGSCRPYLRSVDIRRGRPSLPLEFRDGDRGVELALDPALIAKSTRTKFSTTTVTHCARSGSNLGRRGRDGTAVSTIPLQLEQLNLQPGYYALKLVAIGTPSDLANGAVLLQIERWVHFAVDRSGVRRVSDEEYSDTVDTPELGHSDLGQRVLLHKGGARAGKAPLQDTERSQAMPLGRTGAAIEELPRGYQAETTTPRRGESEER